MRRMLRRLYGPGGNGESPDEVGGEPHLNGHATGAINGYPAATIDDLPAARIDGES